MCVRVCVFLYILFSTRRMLKLTLVVERGRTKGRSRGMHSGGSKAQPLSRVQHLCLHIHAELQGPPSQQSFLLFATFHMALLHTWTEQCDLQHLTVTLSLRERQILLCGQISFAGTTPRFTSLPGYRRISF